MEVFTKIIVSSVFSPSQADASSSICSTTSERSEVVYGRSWQRNVFVRYLDNLFGPEALAQTLQYGLKRVECAHLAMRLHFLGKEARSVA